MPQKEKVMVATGMSLGVLYVEMLTTSLPYGPMLTGFSAGACGIVRTVVLSRLDVYNYTLNFVPYFAWAGAEIAMAMVCIGIPTLRPLYLKTRGIGSGYERQGQSQASELPQFTMCEPKTMRQPTPPLSVSYPRKLADPTRPPSAYTRVSSWDSKEDPMESEYGDIGVIWVKNDVRVHRDYGDWPLRN